jgi:hypothetical protein
VRRQHDAFLPAQQAGQHGMALVRQRAAEIGGHQRQRPCQDICKDEVIAAP